MISIIITLSWAWFLTLFDLDTILVTAVNEVLGTNFSTNVYWLVAFIVAAIIAIIEWRGEKKSKK